MGSSGHYLDPAQAASVYDRIGRWQGTQGFYEGRAVTDMVATARLDTAAAVVEVGCGTGALAASLLEKWLPPESTYLGLDVSPKMVELTRRRILTFGPRARVQQTDGHSPWPVPDDGADRVLAAYVLDLFSPEATDEFFSEAARVLRPGGLVAVTSLAPGPSGPARAVCAAWTRLWRVDPHLTGGCRPVELDPHLPASWHRVHDGTTTSFGVASRALVLEAPA